MTEKWTSTALELLMPVVRSDGTSVRKQIEQRLRDVIRAGTLTPGSMLPSSRVLARDLHISRGVVVDVYEQLVAEGYLEARPGSATRVAASATATQSSVHEPVAALALRYDFRPGVPDLRLFPRRAWLTAYKQALRDMPDAALGYGDPRGAPPLRAVLAAYLGRVRGVVAHPTNTVICTGFAQALGLIGQVLHSNGVGAMAVEEPTHPGQRELIRRAGLEVVPIRVDEDGLRVKDLLARDIKAVLVTPAHQFPTGVVLTPERRAQLLQWARERDGIVIEDDYDAEYRYDRAPVGALQGLAPEHTLYVGSASKMLAPGLRLGWMVVPSAMMQALTTAKRYADLGSPVLEQHTFAHFLEAGALDRHLRRARLVYRARRDAMIAALERHIPSARVHGAAAGLHALVVVPQMDERALVEAVAQRLIGVYGYEQYWSVPKDVLPGLVFGYAAHTESAIGVGVAEWSRALG